MHKKSTLKQSSDYSESVRNTGSKTFEPGENVLAFIKQFARVYYVEKQLPVQVSGFVLN